MTSRWIIKLRKIHDFSKEGADFVKSIGQLKVKCQNNLRWPSSASTIIVTKLITQIGWKVNVVLHVHANPAKLQLLCLCRTCCFTADRQLTITATTSDLDRDQDAWTKTLHQLSADFIWCKSWCWLCSLFPMISAKPTVLEKKLKILSAKWYVSKVRNIIQSIVPKHRFEDRPGRFAANHYWFNIIWSSF